MRNREERLAAVARGQFGVFAGRQAVAAGFPRRTIYDRRRSGVWVPILRDTYRVGGTPVIGEQPIVGAWLSVGEPAAISSRSAAAMWGLGIRPGPTPEVSVPWTRRPRASEIRVTRTRRWSGVEIVRFGALWLTRPSRTLLDLAPVVTEEELERALDAAHRLGLVRIVPLAVYLDDAVRARVPGATTLRRLVRLRDPNRPIESDLETLLFRALRYFGLPLPVPQYRIRTRAGLRRIDFAYPEQRLALETDGYAHHFGRESFEDDRARGNELEELGWSRRHITWRMVRSRPADVAWTIATGLGLEPSRWRPASG